MYRCCIYWTADGVVKRCQGEPSKILQCKEGAIPLCARHAQREHLGVAYLTEWV